ncbi:uncharacterized protein PRCAT00000597001 [Priceomyces carsonii]|uniref:uncharacterized protein n=1 Tax=Priceomyces carsonii TaxID=28549 RepID=UPI002ED9C591|nr:unnamed protein product [Priceomyces carsonii]
MKFLRKPLVTAFTFIAITCVIFFMSSSSNERPLSMTVPVDSKYTKQDISGAIAQTKANGKQINFESKHGEKSGDTINHPYGQDIESAQINDISTTPNDLEYTDTPFMPKMANETLKAQLGNSAWRLFHTILARYPDKPSIQEQTTLNQYIHLFAQVYPCGDCARHFQILLKKYPPQVKSRKTAALWGCDIHNKVNARLDKPDYDCTTILEDYDCGCGDDEKEVDTTLSNESMDNLRNIKIDEKEDLQLGG